MLAPTAILAAGASACTWQTYRWLRSKAHLPPYPCQQRPLSLFGHFPGSLAIMLHQSVVGAGSDARKRSRVSNCED
jgi:hypothetical protein